MDHGTSTEERKNDVQNFLSQVGWLLSLCSGKFSLVSSSAMSNQQEIQPGTYSQDITRGPSGGARLVMQWIVGTMLALLIGSWLVWWAVSLQRQFAEDEIRAACQRVMPETVQRCVDTVVIQRGGARR